MLPRHLRMSSGDVRYLFRQATQKIHARHLSARVFFLPDPVGPPRFAALLPKGSYKNSPDMHRRRRVLYASVASALAQLQKDGTFIPAQLCGLMPRDTFFGLAPQERIEEMLTLFHPSKLPKSEEATSPL